MKIDRPWFGERLERAKQLSAEGNTSDKIAAIISKEFPTMPASRNAIISLWRRLNVQHNRRKNSLSRELLQERNAKIIAMYNAGKTYAEIQKEFGLNGHYIYQVLKLAGAHVAYSNVPKRKSGVESRPRRRSKPRNPNLPTDDIIAAIGVEFVALQANHCRFPVARDPDNYQFRYCGEHRCMNGHSFVSSYCAKHHLVCTREEIRMEAAE